MTVDRYIAGSMTRSGLPTLKIRDDSFASAVESEVVFTESS